MASAHNNFKTMSKEMQTILSRAHTLVDATSGELDDRIISARAALNDRLEAAKGEYSQLEDQLQVKVQSADDYIHGKPYYAIGGSLIAGLFLGWFMSRK